MRSVERQNTQLTARLVNIEGDNQYLEQCVLQLKANVGEHDEKNERLESVNKV